MIVAPEGLDPESSARVKIRAKPKQNLDLLRVGEQVIKLLTPEQTGTPGTDYAVMVNQPSGSLIEIAVPLALMPPELGVTQILNVLSVPSEYDHAESFVIENIELPSSALSKFRGPAIGVDEIQTRFGSTPIGVILKPRLLRNIDAAADMVRQIAAEGVDFVVDDELTIDGPDISFDDRVSRMVGALAGAHSAGDGRNAFFANVTARPQRSLELAARAKDLGAQGLSTNPIVTGFGALEDLAEANFGLPIVATNMGAALLARCPKEGNFAGIAEHLLSKLTRMAGADAVHAGIEKSDWYAQQPTTGGKSILGTKMHKMHKSFRVIAGGLDAIRLIENWPFVGGDYVMFEAGSSVFSHPNGPAAGVRALKTARGIAQEVQANYDAADPADAVCQALALLLQRSEKDAELAPLMQSWTPSEAVNKRRHGLKGVKKGK